MAFNSILRKSSYFVMPFSFAGLLKKNKDSLAPMFHFSSVVVKKSPPPMRKMTITALQYNNYYKMKERMERSMPGGIRQVEGSQNSAPIISLARFAIDEHNKKENATLEFVTVVNAKEQLVAGMLYYITLEAKDGEKMNVYEAEIWVRPWMDFKELRDFKLKIVVGDAPSVDSAM